MPITALPTPPSRNDPTNFATRADAFLGALPNFATEANALASTVNSDAQLAEDWATKTTGVVADSEYSSKEYAVGTTATAGSAKNWAIKTNGAVAGGEYSAKKYAQDASTSASNASSSASAASGSASAAAGSASAAAASAVEAAGLVENYQGALASDPALDKNGGALAAGDWYVNTTTGYVRAYTGSVWVQGISAVAGVASINSLTGALTGFVTESGAQTLTNKTITDPLLTLGAGQGIAGQVLVSKGSGLAPAWANPGAQDFVTQFTGINQPPGSYSPNNSFALI